MQTNQMLLQNKDGKGQGARIVQLGLFAFFL